MRPAALCRQRLPLDAGAVAPLWAAVKGAERRRVERHAAARQAAGTNALHRAQYIGAFIEAHSAALSHRNAVNGRFADASIDIAPRAVSPIGRDAAVGFAAPGGPTAPPVAPVPATPTPFGAWRGGGGGGGGDAAAARAARHTDFVRHCVLREGRTPPEFSPECVARGLPVDGPPLRRLCGRLRRLCAAAAGAAADSATVELLSAAEADAIASLDLSDDGRLALSSLVLQRLVAQSGSPALGAAYLERCLSAGGGGDAAAARAAAAQLIAVYAEAVRCLDVPPAALLPLPALAALLEAGRAGACRGGPAARRLAPVVAAPLLSIAYARDDPAAIRAFAAQHLIHHDRRGLTYLPAIAWGEYLRALHRSGATLAEVQQATDAITDTATTAQAAALLRSPHVWAAYLACADGAHALTVFEANRRHYGLRETPATIAALMGSLARDGGGNMEAVQKGLALYRRLLAGGQGAQVVGTASVLSSLAALHAAAGDLRALLRMCVDLAEVLVYFGVTERWWATETDGARLFAAVSGRSDGAPPAEAPYVAYLRRVAANFSVPPVVEHAITGAIQRTREGPRVPAVELSADALADMM